MAFMQLIVVIAMLGLVYGFSPMKASRLNSRNGKISMYATSTSTPEMLTLEQKLTAKALARQTAGKSAQAKSAATKSIPAKVAPAKVAPVAAKAAPAKVVAAATKEVRRDRLRGIQLHSVSAL